MLKSPPRLKTYEQLSSLMVMLTRACQLDCVYCVYDRSAPPMTRQTLRRSIELLFTAESDGVRLQFFGGEPLLRKEMLLRGIEESERLSRRTGKKARYTVTTNGLSLSRGVLEELAPFGADYLVSFDGGRESQTAQRPLRARGREYPYRRLLDNISALARSGQEFFINMVSSPDAVERVGPNAELLMDMGVERIRFAYRMGVVWESRAASRYFAAVGGILKEARRRGQRLEVYNPLCMDEPDIISPTPTVDCDGSLFLGSVVPALENILPGLKEAARAGDVRSVRKMRDLRRDREEFWREAQRSCAGDAEASSIVRSNLRMGVLSDGFFDELAGLGLTGKGERI